MRTALRSAAVAAACVTAVLAHTPTQTGAIAGQVIDAATGRSVAGATVSLGTATMVPMKPSRTTTSDSLGSFVFKEVEATDYYLAAKTEAESGRYGGTNRDSYGRRLRVAPGAHIEDVTIPLWVRGTVEGRVTDERGAPLAGVEVQFERLESPDLPTVITDPDGHYRARELAPGEYTAVVDGWSLNRPLEADPRAAFSGRTDSRFLIDRDRRTVMLAGPPLPPSEGAGPQRMFVTSAYSRARNGRAEPIHVTGAEVHRGIDIVVRASRTVRVAGKLTTPSGPVNGGVVALQRADSPYSRVEWGMVAGAWPDGTFAFVAVPPGRYALTAYKLVPPYTMARLDEAGRLLTGMNDSFSSDNDDYSLEGSLDVGTNEIPNLVLSMQPGTTVSGTLTVDDHFPAAAKPGCVYLLPLAQRRLHDRHNVSIGCAGPDGAFSLRARPGAYALTAGPLSKDWAYDGASIGGRPLADDLINVSSQPIADLHVGLTSRRRGIAGTVRTSDGRVPISAGVIVFSQDRKWWPSRDAALYARSYNPDRENRTLTLDGHFEFLGLLPGEYFAAVVDEDRSADPLTPATLQRLARTARRVTVRESGVSNVALQLR
jgi:hypothetical protein